MKITIIPGDGIGREVINQAVKVLRKIEKKYKCNFEINEALLGGIAIDKFGTPIPDETINLCKESNAVLLGAVGGPKWDSLPSNLRPEKGLLSLRKELGVFANLRPAILFPQLKAASTLKDELLDGGLDIMIIRELTGGAYFGDKKRFEIENELVAYDVIEYSNSEIERIARRAFETARKRNRKVTLVDKANVLESSRLWREVVTKISEEYPDIKLEYMYVDNAAMQLIRNPKQFDVILTENMFGDILSDEAAMITGSLGMLPSASIGEGAVGLYEPIHGSAPDIEGEDKANPIGTIMSTAMMLHHSFNMENAAKDIVEAIGRVMDNGYRTLDISENNLKIIGTEEMGNLIVGEI